MEYNGSTSVKASQCFVAGIDRGNTFKMIDETSFFHKKHHFFLLLLVIRAVYNNLPFINKMYNNNVANNSYLICYCLAR